MTKIPLEETDLYLSRNEAMPLVEQTSPRRDSPRWWRAFPGWWGGKGIDESLDRSYSLLFSEFAYTCLSLRDAREQRENYEDERPRTILHSLILEDQQSRSEVAASVGVDPVDAGFRETLNALEEHSVVRGILEDDVIRYSLIMPRLASRAYSSFEGWPREH